MPASRWRSTHCVLHPLEKHPLCALSSGEAPTACSVLGPASFLTALSSPSARSPPCVSRSSRPLSSANGLASYSIVKTAAGSKFSPFRHQTSKRRWMCSTFFLISPSYKKKHSISLAHCEHVPSLPLRWFARSGGSCSYCFFFSFFFFLANTKSRCFRRALGVSAALDVADRKPDFFPALSPAPCANPIKNANPLLVFPP